MNTQTLVLLYFLIVVVSADGQQLVNRNEIEFNGMTHMQLTRRIFERERQMIVYLKDFHPMVETYLQSLWPGTKSQSPIDDAYFLSSVDFARASKASGRGRRGYQTHILGGPQSDKVRVINGRKWQLNRDGYLDMLFVDIENFDAETYRLTYMKRETLGETRCLVFFVTPRLAEAAGRFKGQLWVETSSLKIVRMEGTFSSGRISWGKRFIGGSIPIYLSFDSWREEVKPGIWLPRYTYFDEDQPSQNPHAKLEISFHWRGQTFVWGYANKEEYGTGVTPNPASVPLHWFEQRKLLAKPGLVEERLNQMVRQIVVDNKLDVPNLSCRVLMTTPVEMLNLDHTIIVSRGLLNIMPNNSVLSLMLAHQVADVLLGVSEVRSESNLDVYLSSSSAKNGAVPSELHSPTNNATDAWRLAFSFVNGVDHKNDSEGTIAFLNQLAASVKQVPNLLSPQFGLSMAEIAKAVSGLSPSKSSLTTPGPLVLQGRYVVDALSDTLETTANDAPQITSEDVAGRNKVSSASH